ncbi:MAG TPA: DNA methyltransferase [Bacteroidales bacterium]|nr:DNA methyltransferase [Bacteroidales bacterium]
MDKNIDYKKDLAEKLEELKKIEGFPIGTDEDILALSQPPYYTVCPNPYINDFIKVAGKPYNEGKDNYQREPFVGDVSEGKNDPIYNAHSYHTKVPHKAIMKYIEHYTNEGDIVLDGFCGTGMTGVAAQLLNRKAILSDLSPVATFIAYNYNNPINILDFRQNSTNILNQVKNKFDWIYKTNHTENIKGEIDYVAYSDVYLCPFCKNEYVFYNCAVNNKNKVNKIYQCPTCKADITKSQSEIVFETSNDEYLNTEVSQKKQVPVLISYKVGRKKFIKKPDKTDEKVFKRINEFNISEWFPTYRMPEGDEGRRNDRTGLTHVHHLFTKRTLIVLSELFAKCTNNSEILLFTSQLVNLSKLNRYRPDVSFPYNPLSGTLYISSLTNEANVFVAYENKLKKLLAAFKQLSSPAFVQVTSCDNLSIESDTIDYIFTDPPFGDNLMYSNLNFIWESWLKIFTNNQSEAIISRVLDKKLIDYHNLMLKSFREYYRVLKPNRWITVEFHNSKSSVWNAIQEAMAKAGFIISQVTVLDKQQGSFKQVTSAGAVKNDLVISAFKPSNNFSENFIKQAGEGLEITFIKEFLSNLPKKPTIERTDKMLYSKMLAYYIQRGYEIRYDAKSFYRLLKENFVIEDGFWFTTHQIEAFLEYKKQIKLEGLDEIKSGSSLLFVNDEKSALVWLYNFMSEPKSFSDISITFNPLATNIEGDEVPELKEMLEQSFISEDGKFRRPQSETEHNFITEKRQKKLKREFETLLVEVQTQKGKIKLVRKEAIAYGFELCYKEKRFADILSIAKKLDSSILENSGELNDFVEAAEIMIEGIQ